MITAISKNKIELPLMLKKDLILLYKTYDTTDTDIIKASIARKWEGNIIICDSVITSVDTKDTHITDSVVSDEVVLLRNYIPDGLKLDEAIIHEISRAYDGSAYRMIFNSDEREIYSEVIELLSAYGIEGKLDYMLSRTISDISNDVDISYTPLPKYVIFYNDEVRNTLMTLFFLKYKKEITLVKL